MDKKLDLRKNNGGKGNVGRKPAIVKRVSITPRVIKETATFFREETVRLGLSQGEVLDAWAELAKKTTK